MTVLRFRSPLSHREYPTVLAKLREDQVALFVEALQLLAESTAQGERFNIDFEEEHFVARLHKLGKVSHTSDVLLKFGLRARTD